MNYTKGILSNLLLRIRRREARRDPAWRELAQSEEAAYRRLRKGCGRNRELLRQVAELADTEAALAEYAGEYQFFLGLQMGLELGAMDLLGDEEDDVWGQLEFSS